MIRKKYIATEIEPLWQARWEKKRQYETLDFQHSKDKKKYYVLDMFPYPSGDGLHVGHFKGYTATDVISRFLRAKGYNVLHPMGWDAFGLPAENYAIKTGIHPKVTTFKNIKHIKEQMKLVGLSYDWSREIDTTDPNYYKWTQWIFLQLYKKGLAYEAEAPINWCPKDKTGLANEEVVNGCCDRCGTKVVRKKVRQWILAITKYADRLLEGLDGLDWPESIKEMQRNWIGRSEGIEINFPVIASGAKQSGREIAAGSSSPRNDKMWEITVFTKFPETIFGVTYMVVAPEYATLGKLVTTDRLKEATSYVRQAQSKSDLERTALEKEKTGVFTGSYCINPVNGQKVPIWISDYVIGGYGTGAVMGVPGSDERDFDFAVKYQIPIIKVISAKKGDLTEIKSKGGVLEEGYIVNSGKFDGMSAPFPAKEKFMDYFEQNSWGERKTNYKLRDWIFSRQRYWGEPIPVIFCENCAEIPNSKVQITNRNGKKYAIVPVPEEDLPVMLPEVEKYQPTGTGESPLAAIDKWVNVKCPNCGQDAKRETNTMPQWAGSCWYYLRFIDPKNEKELVSKDSEGYWMGKTENNSIGGVDWYVGGAEHAVLHLLYARFWHKFLFDAGIVSTEEPFYKLRNVGLIMGPDGQKMSKSRGNVISPEEMVKTYGADTLRLFEMFIGPFGDVADWKPAAVEGVYRFLQRVWLMSVKIIESKRQESENVVLREINRTIKKIEEDIWEMKFNTSVASMMEFVNFASRDLDRVGVDSLRKFLQVLAPFAPHIAEEIWQELKGTTSSQGTTSTTRMKRARDTRDTLEARDTFDSIHSQPWPEWDEKLIEGDMVTIVVQVNGKMRGSFQIKRGASQHEVEKTAKELPKVENYLAGKNPRKVIFVPEKLISFVV